MPRRSRVVWTLTLTITAWLLFLPAANAYIDPGSTSFVFQAVVAGIAAAGMTFKLFWRRIKDFFSRSGRSAGDDVHVTPGEHATASTASDSVSERAEPQSARVTADEA